MVVEVLLLLSLALFIDLALAEPHRVIDPKLFKSPIGRHKGE